MSCERIENLLAAFVEGDLSSRDETEVHTHVAACESCRESLGAYRALEGALEMRRAQVPPVDSFLRGVVAPAATNLHRARVLMDAIFSFPALASFFCLVIAWMAYAYSGAVERSLDWVVGEASVLSRFASWLTATMMAVTGGDMLVTAVAYAGLTILILGSGTLMTLHYVHGD